MNRVSTIVPGASYREVLLAIGLEGAFQQITAQYHVDWSRERFFRIGARVAANLERPRAWDFGGPKFRQFILANGGRS